MTVPVHVAIIGAGEIGSGWAALFAAHGANVRIADPDPGAVERATQSLERARALGVGRGERGGGRIEARPDIAAATEGVEWVQESVPEDLEHKRRVLREADAAAPPNAIIGTSTSTFILHELAPDDRAMRRTIIVHPLHPVYAVPLVELCGGSATTSHILTRATEMLRALGRYPIVVHGEKPGLVANRLTAALLREAFDLIARGVIDADGLDGVVAQGIALGWVADGPLMTEAIGMGASSLEGLPDRIDGTLARLWPSLAAWPEMDQPARERLRRAFRRVPPRDDLVD